MYFGTLHQFTLKLTCLFITCRLTDQNQMEVNGRILEHFCCSRESLRNIETTLKKESTERYWLYVWHVDSSDAFFTLRIQHSRPHTFARVCIFFFMLWGFQFSLNWRNSINFSSLNTKLRLRLLLMSIPQFELKNSNISIDVEEKMHQRGFKCCRFWLIAWGQLNTWLVFKCGLFSSS